MNKYFGIQKMHEQLSHKISELSKEMPILPGTFGTTFVKCGTSSCWCSKGKGKGHPFNRITWSDSGKTRTRSILLKDISWIKEVTQNYREFKKIKREIKTLQVKLTQEIDKWEMRLVKRTRKTKGYFKNL